METIADEVGWVPTAKDRPEVKAILRDHAPRRSIEVTDRDGSIRVQRHLDGSITADRSLIQTHTDLSAQLAANRQRVSLSDLGRVGIRLRRRGVHAIPLGGPPPLRSLPDRHFPRRSRLASRMGILGWDARTSSGRVHLRLGRAPATQRLRPPDRGEPVQVRTRRRSRHHPCGRRRRHSLRRGRLPLRLAPPGHRLRRTGTLPARSDGVHPPRLHHRATGLGLGIAEE